MYFVRLKYAKTARQGQVRFCASTKRNWIFLAVLSIIYQQKRFGYIVFGERETGDGVCFTLDGEEHFVEADQVVISAGIRADGILLQELEALGIKAVSAGDASRGKNGLANIYEGFLAGIRA